MTDESNRKPSSGVVDETFPAAPSANEAKDLQKPENNQSSAQRVEKTHEVERKNAADAAKGK